MGIFGAAMHADDAQHDTTAAGAYTIIAVIRAMHAAIMVVVAIRSTSLPIITIAILKGPYKHTHRSQTIPRDVPPDILDIGPSL